MYDIVETYNGYDHILLKNDIYNLKRERQELKNLFNRITNALSIDGIEIYDNELYSIFMEFLKTGRDIKEFERFVREKKLLRNSKLKKSKIKSRIRLFFHKKKIFTKVKNSLKVIQIKYFKKIISFEDELFIMKMRFGARTANKIQKELKKLGVSNLKEQVDFNVLKFSANRVFSKNKELSKFINKEKNIGIIESIKLYINNTINNIVGNNNKKTEFKTLLESIGEKSKIGNKIKKGQEKDIIAVSKLIEKEERTRKASSLDNDISATRTRSNSLLNKLKKGITLSMPNASNKLETRAETPEKTIKIKEEKMTIEKETKKESGGIIQEIKDSFENEKIVKENKMPFEKATVNKQVEKPVVGEHTERIIKGRGDAIMLRRGIRNLV